MKLAILELDAPPDPLRERFGSYGQMVLRLLGEDIAARAFEIRRGDLPLPDRTFDAWIVVGAGLPFDRPPKTLSSIRRLIREVSGAVQLLGIGTGHHLLAETFCGEVAVNGGRWRLGLDAFQIIEREPWMGRQSILTLPVLHRPQVLRPPPTAQVLARSPLAPLAMLRYGSGRTVGLQAHPEFEPDFTRALIDYHRSVLDPEACQRAANTLDEPNASRVMGEWLRAFVLAAHLEGDDD